VDGSELHGGRREIGSRHCQNQKERNRLSALPESEREK